MRHHDVAGEAAYRAAMICEVHAGRVPDHDDPAILERNFRSAHEQSAMDAVAAEWEGMEGADGLSVAEMGGTDVPEALVAASASRLRWRLETARARGATLEGAVLAAFQRAVAHEHGYLIARRLEGVAEAAAASRTTT